MNAITAFGGVYIEQDMSVKFPCQNSNELVCLAGVMRNYHVEDVDYDITFDGTEWTLKWKWNQYDCNNLVKNGCVASINFPRDCAQNLMRKSRNRSCAVDSKSIKKKRMVL